MTLMCLMLCGWELARVILIMMEYVDNINQIDLFISRAPLGKIIMWRWHVLSMCAFFQLSTIFSVMRGAKIWI